METPTPTTEFFKAGGTLPEHAPSYVQRPADDLLFSQVAAGQLCYVLTPRQMGKSSLMIRTVARLQATGVHTAIVDLSALGVHVSSAQWYLGILTCLAEELQLGLDVQAWWQARASLGVVQRFTDFINDVVLAQINGRIVVFFDEIDSTLSLNFTDDFFAAIRVMYNLRASNAEYDRLTFVLLGVAAPADLSKDRNRTPFNIGQAIDLKEFSRADAQPLAAGLAAVYPDEGNQLLDQIFHWTNGHPYLTQKICSELVKDDIQNRTATMHHGCTKEVVDECVTRLFLSDAAKDETNLQFVRNRVLAYPDIRPLLQLYRRIYQGESVTEDKRSPLQNELRLIGLIDTQKGQLHVRNEIYRHVFDLAWIKATTPVNRALWVTASAVAVIILSITAVLYYQFRQTEQAVAVFSQGFRESEIPHIKLQYLADICNQRQEAGRHLFFEELAPEAQLQLFQTVNITYAGASLVGAVHCLQPAQLPADRKAALTQAMCDACKQWVRQQTPPISSTNGFCGCP